MAGLSASGAAPLYTRCTTARTRPAAHTGRISSPLLRRRSGRFAWWLSVASSSRCMPYRPYDRHLCSEAGSCRSIRRSPSRSLSVRAARRSCTCCGTSRRAPSARQCDTMQRLSLSATHVAWDPRSSRSLRLRDEQCACSRVFLRSWRAPTATGHRADTRRARTARLRTFDCR